MQAGVGEFGEPGPYAKLRQPAGAFRAANLVAVSVLRILEQRIGIEGRLAQPLVHPDRAASRLVSARYGTASGYALVKDPKMAEGMHRLAPLLSAS